MKNSKITMYRLKYADEWKAITDHFLDIRRMSIQRSEQTCIARDEQLCQLDALVYPKYRLRDLYMAWLEDYEEQIKEQDKKIYKQK